MSEALELNNISSLEGLLCEALPAEAPADIIKGVTPWRRAMKLVLSGLILSLAGMEFFPFDIPINAAGLILSVLGNERLRKENNAFRASWVLSIVGLAICFIRIVLICFAVPLEMSRLKVGTALGYTSVAIILLMIIFLFAALINVEKKAGMSINACNAGKALLWYLIVRAMNAAFGLRDTLGIHISHPFVYIILLLCAVALLFHAMYRLMKELGEPGYSIELCAPKISGKVLAAVLVAAAVLIYLAGHLCDTYPTDWQQTEGSSVPAQEASRLTECGMPGEMISMLTEEDLAILQGAEIRPIETDSSEEAAEKSIPLDMRSFIIKKGSDWYTMVYFKTTDGTQFYGTNGITLGWIGGAVVGDGTTEGRLLPGYISSRIACDLPVPADPGTESLRTAELFGLAPDETNPFQKYHLGSNLAVFDGFSVPKNAGPVRCYALTAVDPPEDDTVTVSMILIKCKPGFKPVPVSAKEYMDTCYRNNLFAIIAQDGYFSTTDLIYFNAYTYKASGSISGL